MDNMADSGGADTFEYTINGRVLVFHKIDQGQLIMLERYVDTQRAKAAKMVEAEDLDGVIEIGKKINKAVWTTVESQFTSPDDLEWVQMEIIARRLTEDDLIPLLSNGITRTPVQDDADPPPPVKRPGRKAPAKKAAKKAAPRRGTP